MAARVGLPASRRPCASQLPVQMIARVYTCRDACRFLGVLLATRRLSSTYTVRVRCTDARCFRRTMHGCWKQEGLLCVYYSWWGDGRWPKYRVPIVVCAYNVSVLRLKGLVLFCELFVRHSVWGFISSRGVLSLRHSFFIAKGARGSGSACESDGDDSDGQGAPQGGGGVQSPRLGPRSGNFAGFKGLEASFMRK